MYASFYGLRLRPFQLSPDPHFFFSSRGHKRALAYLRYGLKQGEGFIIITGDVGTGKTTLAGALLRMIEREQLVAGQIVTTQLDADDLVRMVAAAFELPFQGMHKVELLKALEDYFRSLRAEGKRALLVVDEAQNLPPRAIEELRMLSNFQQDGQPLLQSFLLGQREFRVLMRSKNFEQLRQRVIAAYHLRPLDEEETRAYIEHRLKTAGWSGDPAFAPAVFPIIHGFTGGVPRRINTLCDRLLLYGSLEAVHTIGEATLATVLNEITEEQGDGLDTPASTESPSGQAIDDPYQGRPTRPTAVDTNTTLANMESSVAQLTKAMHEELARLRLAITKSTDPPKDSD